MKNLFIIKAIHVFLQNNLWNKKLKRIIYTFLVSGVEKLDNKNKENKTPDNHYFDI